MTRKGYKVVLTSERCMMSSYHGSLFLGFCACAPRKLWKSLFFFNFICPSVPAGKNGIATLAPYGTRRIEAALLNYGFQRNEVAVAHPSKIHRLVGPDTKVIGITSNDPLGKGPASTTFSMPTGFLRDMGEPYDAWKFRELTTDPYLKKWGAKIIVGGPGSWQLKDAEARRKLNVDVVVVGEGENVSPPIIKSIVEGKATPEVIMGDIVELEAGVKISGGTVGGVVEVSRGCGRGCKFCIPTLLKLRSRPIEDILAEVRVNIQYGQNKIILHAEDILRYGAKSIKVEKHKVLDLFKSVAKLDGVENISPSHFALASAASEPSLLEEITFTLGEKGKPWLSGQTGIETGSPHMIEKHMPGKALPFKPAEWPDVVEQAFGICKDADWVPCGTLVMGLPGEGEDDVLKTIELVDRLKDYKSLIVPLFFVPIGTLTFNRGFSLDDMKDYHWQLALECWDHGMRWAEELSKQYIYNIPLIPRFFLLRFMNQVVKKFSKKARGQIIKIMEQTKMKQKAEILAEVP